jgi:Ni,Fe-hydrogenase III large subunit/NADH:ubiquinone oxidoreductase subunit C
VKSEAIAAALRRTFPGADVTSESGLLGETFVALPSQRLHRAVGLLVEQFGVRHLSTITAQDVGDDIELLYHFWAGEGLTLRTVLPKSEEHIATITDLVTGASFYEREAAEMLGVVFDGHPDPRPLLLPDDWMGGSPLRSNWSEPNAASAHLPEPQVACELPEEPAPEITVGERMIIPIGPQHPLLKEPLSYLLTVEGERVVDNALRIGYVHRGIERLCQQRNYVQNTYLLERICGICSHIHTATYCQGVEALLELQVPPRAHYLRTLMCELERIHSHLLVVGVLAENIGFTTIFMYAWRDREIVLDIMEELSGGRVSHAATVIGGVQFDLDEKHARSILARLDDFEKQMEALRNVIHHERSFQMRTRDLGHLSAEQVLDYCVVGPMARASGVDVDLRRDAPYAAYKDLHLRVVTAFGGDVWARTQVRVQEVLESLHLCRQLVEQMPDGPATVRAPRRVPAGEVVSRMEAPRGELIYYIRSDGSDRPARVKVRTPTITSLMSLSDQLRGISIADVPAVIGGMDLCIACADR